jgi:hypothetical protein
MRMAIARQQSRAAQAARTHAVPVVASPARGPTGALLTLQRTIGNRATSHLVASYRADAGGDLGGLGGRSGGAGRPLDPATRAFMEARFGEELGAVRVHADPRSARSAERLGALAYTVGRDIYFAAGQYRPTTAAGRHLLAHELTHVVQQSGAGNGNAAALSPGHQPAEREADRTADAVSGGLPAQPRIRMPRSIQRQGALLAFLAEHERRGKLVQSLAATGSATIGLFQDPGTGKISGYQLTKKFTLTFAKDARADDYAIVQWIKGELYQQQDSKKVYWPANAGGGLYGKGATDPWFFTDWIIDTPDADPRFGSHYGLTVKVPTTSFSDNPGIVMHEGRGPLPAGLRYVVSARMGVYPWYRVPRTISDWQSMKPTPFQEVVWGWDVTVDPSQDSLTVDVT